MLTIVLDMVSLLSDPAYSTRSSLSRKQILIGKFLKVFWYITLCIYDLFYSCQMNKNFGYVSE